MPVKRIPEDIRELLQVLESATRTEDETASRVRLPKGQSAYLSFELDEGSGYRSVKLSLETPKLEQAVIAALTALNGREVEPLRVRRSIHASETLQEALRSLAKGEPRQEPSPEIKRATVGDVSAGRSLRYVQLLLRHYRPDFDSMAKEEQVALTTRFVEHANEFLDALRKLSDCLQYGHPYRGLPNTPMKQAARDVRAAELRDIDELTYKEIGSRLEVKPYKHDADRNDDTAVRTRCVPNGRNILKKVLGLDDEGYNEYIEAKKAEAQKWSSLPKSRKWAELFAQDAEIPTEKLHRIMTCNDEDLIDEISRLKDEIPGLDEDQISSLAWARASWESYGDRGQDVTEHP
jgi:hypothetical protein